MEINVHYNDVNASHILGEALKEIINRNDNNIVLVCIGSDKFIFDSLGPLVGTLLVDIGIPMHIFGTLDNPIHAENIKIRIKDKFPSYKVIAVDSSLGNEEDVGLVIFKEGSVKPGKGVGKEIFSIGDYAIKAIIEKSEARNYLTQLPLRLRYIFQMAVAIRDAFKYVYSCTDKN